MIQGMAIYELDDPRAAERLNLEGYCGKVDVEIGDGRTWRVLVSGLGEIAPDSLEAALIRTTAQVVANATAEEIGEEELIDDSAPAEREIAAADDAPAPPRLIRRIIRPRRPDPFGHHDHGPVQGGNCKPFQSLHHDDCARLFSNNNEGSCILIGNDVYRCSHGTLSGP